jgi:phage tail sheath gpL-like
MPISFDNIPANWRMPLYWVEVDPSMAGLPIVRNPALIIGTMNISTKKVGTAVVAFGGNGYVVGNTITLPNGVVLTVATVTGGVVATTTITKAGSINAASAAPTNPVQSISTNGPGTGAAFTLTWVNDVVLNPNADAGTGVPNVPIPIGTQAQADNLFGQGSELALMCKAFFANNFAQETWALPVTIPTGSTAATGSIVVAGAPVEAGQLDLYIAGHHVDNIVVGTTDTPTTIAALISACINADPTLPVWSSAAVDTVTLTCKTPGINGDEISVQMNYYGKVGGQMTPPGLILALPATGLLTGGAGVPSYDAAISALGENEYEYVCLAHTDSNTLFDFENEWSFGDNGRWGWMRQLYGHLFAAKRATYSDLIIFGATRNFGITSIMAWEPTAASPTYEVAAAYCAKAARALTNDPARPLQTLSLDEILPAQHDLRFNLPELNSLSGAGIATQRTGKDGATRIMRETTTYQLNTYGYSDDAYELVTTLATLAKLIRNQRQAITSKFPRYKLADDGTRFGVGQKIVTPKTIKAELVAQYRIDEFNGLVENVTAFKANLIVERDPNDPNRVNTLYPPDLVNQLRVFAVLAQFRLQYNRGQDLEIIN